MPRYMIWIRYIYARGKGGGIENMIGLQGCPCPTLSIERGLWMTDRMPRDNILMWPPDGFMMLGVIPKNHWTCNMRTQHIGFCGPGIVPKRWLCTYDVSMSYTWQAKFLSFFGIQITNFWVSHFLAGRLAFQSWSCTFINPLSLCRKVSSCPICYEVPKGR